MMDQDYMSATDIDLTKILSINQQANVDDCIVFDIYCDEVLATTAIIDSGNDKNSTADNEKVRNAAPGAVEYYLYKRLLQILAYTQDFAGRYSWTCCPFFLEIVSASATCPSHLHGRVRVGDNIEEEWLVVYILRYITTQFPDVSITVQDTDGELLLIEAANNLPSWLTPQTAVNRVFLRRGTVNILPGSLSSSNKASSMTTAGVLNGIINVDDIVGVGRVSNNNNNNVRRNHGQPDGDPTDLTPSIVDALRALRSDQFSNYSAKLAVQKSIYRRAKDYEDIANNWMRLSKQRLKHEQPDHSASVDDPQSTMSSISSAALCASHRCNVVVPVPIAVLLKQYPHLAGVALDFLPPSVGMLKHKSSHENSSLATFDCSDSSVPTVICPIYLNRCQFSRLTQLRFRVPAKFALAQWRLLSFHGDAVGSLVGRDAKHSEVQHRRAMERGAKLCLGLFSAYMSESRTTDAVLSFFWDSVTGDSSQNTGDSSQNTRAQLPTVLPKNSVQHAAARCERFVKLLSTAGELRGSFVQEQDDCNEKLRRNADKVASKKDELQAWSVMGQVLKLSQMRNTQDGVGVAGERVNLNKIKFRDVFDVVYQKSKLYDQAGTMANIISTTFCQCCPDSKRRPFDGGLGCSGIDCAQESDDEAWMEVSPEDVEKMISGKQKEDVFRQLVREELSKETCQSTKDINSTSNKKVSDGENCAQTQKTTIKSTLPISSPITADVDIELDEMFVKFKDFLQTTSGLGGVDDSKAARLNLSEASRKVLRGKLPEEFLEYLDDYESDHSDEDCNGHGDDDDDDDDDDVSDDSDENKLEMDDEMNELLRAMDRELSSFTINTRNSAAVMPGPSGLGAIPEDMSEGDEDEDDIAKLTRSDMRESFRQKSPMDLTDKELSDILVTNMCRSRREDLLHPGPATMLTKIRDKIV